MIQKTVKKITKSPKALGKNIAIEYPKENEILTHHIYTIKLQSSENKNVEVSIDNGPWVKCRYDDNCWWFDWG